MYYILCNTFYRKKKIKAMLLSDVNRFYLKIDAFILALSRLSLFLFPCIEDNVLHDTIYCAKRMIRKTHSFFQFVDIFFYSEDNFLLYINPSIKRKRMIERIYRNIFWHWVKATNRATIHLHWNILCSRTKTNRHVQIDN
jgi:hypothetical protein